MFFQFHRVGEPSHGSSNTSTTKAKTSFLWSVRVLADHKLSDTLMSRDQFFAGWTRGKMTSHDGWQANTIRLWRKGILVRWTYYFVATMQAYSVRKANIRAVWLAVKRVDVRLAAVWVLLAAYSIEVPSQVCDYKDIGDAMGPFFSLQYRCFFRQKRYFFTVASVHQMIAIKSIYFADDVWTVGHWCRWCL